VSLGAPRRIWAISAIHAELDKLTAIHDELVKHVCPGDRIVYLGNYIGYGASPRQTIDELLTFRRLILSMPGMLASDIVYLRGGQEEMWQKLLQIQFAPNPAEILLWVLGKGLSSTLESYGINPHEGLKAAQEGVMSLTRWTAALRIAIRKNPGHEIFGTQLKRAAFVPEKYDCPVLFVNAGINPKRPLVEQGDSFWWAGNNFNSISVPYAPFQKVIRGYDPAHGGMNINCVTATIDGGCGFGGALVCAGFDNGGELFEMIEA
jgi:serine/threonine protein phosphatase 1